MSLGADRDGGVTTVGLDLDVLLWPQRALQSVTNATAKPLSGGGLVADVWSGKLPVPSPSAALLYGVIPADATPETILSITRALQAF